jgi:hypothetical protein
MYTNSLIYSATPTNASIESGGVLPLTTIVRRRGCNISQLNDSFVLKAPGYYHVSISATFSAPVPGNVSLNIVQDNVNVQSATATTTITTANTEIRTLTMNAIIRVPCNCSSSVLTVVNSGVAINTSNIAIDVEHLA